MIASANHGQPSPRTLITRRTALAGAVIAGADPLSAASAMAQSAIVERADLAAAFVEAGATGSMAIIDTATGSTLLVNAERARRRLIPASTFKIASSLIALETGAVKDEHEVIPFGGGPQPVKSWERDMGMREAFPLSNVAVYQAIARRIGLERFVEWLQRLDYGNRQVGAAVDQFWLVGPLEISALEQAVFVARLARSELPLSERSMRIVREIARLEVTSERVLHGKTGWSGRTTRIGWLTGWVDHGGSVTAFSLTMDMAAIADAPKRLQIARRILASLGKL